MQCFQKDPNLRVSAKRLLKHPWILSARRLDTVVPDQAVKSVQRWNEALKSPNAGTLKKSVERRPMSSSPIPRRSDQFIGITAATPVKAGQSNALSLAKPRPSAEAFRSPQGEGRFLPSLTKHKLIITEDDNWDNDFASAISPSALHLPHLKPQDNFGGLFSSDKLKAFATYESDGAEENWDDNFEGELTVKSPLQLSATDPLENMRPFFPSRANTDQIQHTAPSKSPNQKDVPILMNPPVRGSSKQAHALQSMPNGITSASRPAAAWREDVDEDYSDLEPINEQFFAQKLHSQQRKTSFPSSGASMSSIDLVMTPPSVVGSMRKKRGPHSGQGPYVESQQSVEIERYAESEGEEDYSDVFGSEQVDTPSSESGSEHGTLVLNSKLSHNSWVRSLSFVHILANVRSLETKKTMMTRFYNLKKGSMRWVSVQSFED
jgi:hypothetical protein